MASKYVPQRSRAEAGKPWLDNYDFILRILAASYKCILKSSRTEDLIFFFTLKLFGKESLFNVSLCYCDQKACLQELYLFGTEVVNVA